MSNQFTRGVDFASNVGTKQDLYALVENAKATPALIGDQDVLATPNASDYVMVNSGGLLKKVTVASLTLSSGTAPGNLDASQTFQMAGLFLSGGATVMAKFANTADSTTRFQWNVSPVSGTNAMQLVRTTGSDASPVIPFQVTGAAVASALTINDKGVGIGAASAAEKLEVTGNAKVSGTLNVVGVATAGAISTAGITASGNMTVDNVTVSGSLWVAGNIYTGGALGYTGPLTYATGHVMQFRNGILLSFT